MHDKLYLHPRILHRQISTHTLNTLTYTLNNTLTYTLHDTLTYTPTCRALIWLPM